MFYGAHGAGWFNTIWEQWYIMTYDMHGKNNPMYGKKHSEITKIKIGEKSKGRIIFSEEQKNELRKRASGENNPFYGKHHSDETKKKLRDLKLGHKLSPAHIEALCAARKGRKQPESAKKKLSINRKGCLNPAWRGGTSFGKYCPKFTKVFKDRVRRFFNYTCVGCGKTQSENKKKLNVHHVNYDKMVCCNNTKPLFVSLCKSCHTKTNHNRDMWEIYFTNIINGNYGGVCYVEEKK